MTFKRLRFGLFGLPQVQKLSVLETFWHEISCPFSSLLCFLWYTHSQGMGQKLSYCTGGIIYYLKRRRERALPHRIVQYRTCRDLLPAPKSALNPINYSLGWRWREYTISRRRKKEPKFPFWNYFSFSVLFSFFGRSPSLIDGRLWLLLWPVHIYTQSAMIAPLIAAVHRYFAIAIIFVSKAALLFS